MKPNYRFRRLALRTERGFTLVELMVTVAIALFLIGGLLTVLQDVRIAYNNQQSLSQLQDEQRFALTVLADVIQAGGFFPDSVAWQPQTSLPASGSYAVGQAFFGTHPGGAAPDTIGIRYRTALNDGVIMCDGSTNTTVGPTRLYVNTFTVVPPAGNVPGQLQCQLIDGNTGGNIDGPVTLVNGVQKLVVYYGVKRNPVPADYNVDTYLTADQMNAGNGDWSNISSVRVILTFTNPLCPPAGPCQAGQQPTIIFERVIEVMSRAGVHS
jgi:type IV pilus assembly protein PilW